MDILSDKIVTTRKKHRCSACGRVFGKGTKMQTQVNTSDGIQVWRTCPTCTELLSKHRDKFEDDYDHLCYEFCVNESLEKGQTPEELLASLNVA
jgi:ribosomal protein S27AE